MPVSDAQARISESEFTDWQLWFEHRNELAERQRQGLPMHDSDNADELTPAQSAAYVAGIFTQLSARREP